MTEDRQQIIYALERAEIHLIECAKQAMVAGDYGAEFPQEDAYSIRQAIELIQAMP